MKRIVAAVGCAALTVSAFAWTAAARGSGGVGARRSRAVAAPCSTLDPSSFVSVIDNPYYPLPVGRTLVYTGHQGRADPG